MMRLRLRKRMVMGLAVCALLAGGVYTYAGGYHRVHLPGVDHYGNLSHHLGGHARLKVICDSRYHTFCAKAHGYVKNKSGHRQVYYNRLWLGLRYIADHYNIPYHAISITQDLYTVERGSYFHHHRARCCALVCGRFHQDPYENGPA